MYASYSTALKNLLAQRGGKSLGDAMVAGTICLFSGSRPVNADAAEGMNPLCQLTLNSGAFTPGSTTNGINLATSATGGTVQMNTGEIWSGNGNSNAGTSGTTATWARWYSNAMTTGGNGVNIDMDVATSGAALTLTNPTIVQGAPTAITTMAVTING